MCKTSLYRLGVSFTPPCFQSSAGIPDIDAIQQFLDFRFFIKRCNVWSQCSGVQDRAINPSSSVKWLVKVVCKSVENLSFLLYYCLTIKVSKLCCTRLLCPMYFCQIILKVLSHLFFLLPLPPIFDTSFP